MKKILNTLAAVAVTVALGITAISCDGLYGRPVEDNTDTSNLNTLWTGSVDVGTDWNPKLVEGVKEAIATGGYSRAAITVTLNVNKTDATYWMVNFVTDSAASAYLTGALEAANKKDGGGEFELMSAAESFTFMPTADDWTAITTNGLYAK